METLTSEQYSIIKALAEGKNVFMTGCGGTGKSYVIGLLGSLLEPLMGKKLSIEVTALTGCAALLLGPKAKTLHSWAGIGLGREEPIDLVWKINRNGRAKKYWRNTDLLVIDEISMLTAELLEKLNEIGQRMRKCFSKPFGGIQLLLVGDFYQLPPVAKDKAVVFAFESRLWSTVVQETIELRTIHRQKDPVFQGILAEARSGTLSAESQAVLRSRMGLDWKSHKIRPTLLFPKNAEVDMINDVNIKALKGRPYVYKVQYAYGSAKIADKTKILDSTFMKTVATMDRDAMYRSELTLLVGAQVMLIANLDIEKGLVNGSRGVVTGFTEKTSDKDEGDVPIVEFLNGLTVPVNPHKWEIEGHAGVYRCQIPLRLAWACTIHKAQGATLDCALIDIGENVFEYGQAYVALSRVKNLESLYVHDFSPLAFKTHTKVSEFYVR